MLPISSSHPREVRCQWFHLILKFIGDAKFNIIASSLNWRNLILFLNWILWIIDLIWIFSITQNLYEFFCNFLKLARLNTKTNKTATFTVRLKVKAILQAYPTFRVLCFEGEMTRYTTCYRLHQKCRDAIYSSRFFLRFQFWLYETYSTKLNKSLSLPSVKISKFFLVCSPLAS